MLAAAEHWTAAVAVGGALYTWGHDDQDDHEQGRYGRLGHSYGHDVDVPTIVGDGLEGKCVVSVAVGRRHGAAVTSDGEVFTWGEYIYGNPGPDAPTLVRGVLEGKRILSVSAGTDFTTALTSGGEVYTWDCGKCGAPGSEGFGDIDDLADSRTLVGGGLVGKRVVGVSASDSHSVAVTADGEVFSWGEGDSGCLGHGNEEDVLTPKQVEGILTGLHVVTVAVDDMHTAVVTREGRLFVWGASYDFSLISTRTLVPTLVGGALADKRVVGVSVGDSHMAAVTDAGECYTWGSGEWGRLGHGDTEHRFTPTLVTGALSGKRVVEVGAAASGGLHTAAVTLEGDLYTWGGGEWRAAMEYGFYSDLCKLGHGPIDDEEWYHVPRLVSSLTKWSVDPRLLVWSRATHLRFPRAFRDTVGALILAVNCTASAVASVDENPGRIIFETQPPGLWGEGFAEVATSEPAILAGQHRWHSHTQVS